MLRGKRILLRPVKRADIQYFLKWFNDPEVTQYLDLHLPTTEMAMEKDIEELTRTGAVFMIDVTQGDSSKCIGSTMLDHINPKDHNAEFNIVIGEKECWSKGYGTEVARLLVNYGFEQLNLHRINSSAFGFNERSIRMHKAVGFIEEGRQREGGFKNCKYHAHVMFGILRTEWRGL